MSISLLRIFSKSRLQKIRPEYFDIFYFSIGRHAGFVNAGVKLRLSQALRAAKA